MSSSTPASSPYISIPDPSARAALASSSLGYSFLAHPDGGFEPYVVVPALDAQASLSSASSSQPECATRWQPGRFIMTPVRETDAQAQVEMNNHPAIYTSNPGPPLPYTSEQASRFVTRQQALERSEFDAIIAGAKEQDRSHADAAHWSTSRWWPLLIIRDTQPPATSRSSEKERSGAFGGTYAGEVAFLKVGEAEWVIGCNIHPSLWNLGLATAAVQLVLARWAFPNTTHCQLVKAETNSDNIASQKVYKRCGFVWDEARSGARHAMHESRGGGEDKIEWVYTWTREGAAEAAERKQQATRGRGKRID